MPIALPETTELNAHVLPISWVKPDPDVTLNVPDMTIAKTTRLVFLPWQPSHVVWKSLKKVSFLISNFNFRVKNH